MKKKQIYFLALAVLLSSLLLSSCKIYAPVFKTVENPRFEKIGNSGIKMGAEIVFENPNKIKCTIKDIDINIILDNKQIGTLGEKSDVKMAKQSEFRIPLGIMVNPQGTTLDNLNTIIKLISNKESDLSLNGKVAVKFLGITVPIPVKYNTKFKLSDIKK